MSKVLWLQWSIIGLLSFSAGIHAVSGFSAEPVPTDGFLMANVSNDAYLSYGPPQPSARHSIKGVSVPLERDDRALLLEATMNNQVSTTFILDTGATYTSISQDMAKKLGYNLQKAKRVTITTANGQVSFPKITLKSITINGYTAHNVEATVMPLPRNVPFNGLLGLNFVKGHRITIDSAADHMLIEPTHFPYRVSHNAPEP